MAQKSNLKPIMWSQHGNDSDKSPLPAGELSRIVREAQSKVESAGSNVPDATITFQPQDMVTEDLFLTGLLEAQHQANSTSPTQGLLWLQLFAFQAGMLYERARRASEPDTAELERMFQLEG